MAYNFLKKIKTLWLFYVLELVLFVLIVLGVLPRSIVPYFVGLLALYTIFSRLEDAVLFFVASIPLFIAIPITDTWDSFNTWRILSIIIFLRWIFSKGNFHWLISGVLDFVKNPISFTKKNPAMVALLAIAIITELSVLFAHDIRAGLQRLIYFYNLSLVGIVVYDLTRNSLAGQAKLEIRDLIRSIFVATAVVVVVGYIQVISTYFIDVYQFMRLWGEDIQLRQFGTVWSNIAVRMGNTWLAYYGPQLSLRVFSLFPDSHSFPVFVLFGIPALFAFGIRRLVRMSDVLKNLKKLVRTYANWSVLWIPAAFLIIILSGTRGIWAASIPVVVFIILIGWIRLPKWNFLLLYKLSVRNVYKDGYIDKNKFNLFRYISLYLIVFFMLFAVAYPIFVSPQFLLAKGDWALFGERIRSIIDFGETSNSARIWIWGESLKSIAREPLLGVGLGNFPIVLEQDVFLARAGSSAHNIYLQIASELGIPALLLSLLFLWLMLVKIYKNYISEDNYILLSYWAALLIFFPWVLAYLMTDSALLDERAFLIFVVTAGIVFGKTKSGE